MVADDRTDDRGLAVTGLPGLKFDSRLGMAYELNTTGQSMSLSIPTPLGNQNHTFVDGQLDRLKGQGEFHVDGNVGQVFNTTAFSRSPTPTANWRSMSSIRR